MDDEKHPPEKPHVKPGRGTAVAAGALVSVAACLAPDALAQINYKAPHNSNHQIQQSPARNTPKKSDEKLDWTAPLGTKVLDNPYAKTAVGVGLVLAAGAAVRKITPKRRRQEAENQQNERKAFEWQERRFEEDLKRKRGNCNQGRE